MHRSAHVGAAPTPIRSAHLRYRVTRGELSLSRRPIVEARIPWPRGRFWRPGEPITLTKGDASVTYLLRGVMRDADPESVYATVLLEPIRTVATDVVDDVASASG
jgi:hypothetical protein